MEGETREGARDSSHNIKEKKRKEKKRKEKKRKAGEFEVILTHTCLPMTHHALESGKKRRAEEAFLLS